MKLFETSILEIICAPLKLAGIKEIRAQYIYEHVFTPVLAAVILSRFSGCYKWVGFMLVVSFHFLIKEFCIDFLKHRVMNWQNVIERGYGVVLGVMVLI